MCRFTSVPQPYRVRADYIITSIVPDKAETFIIRLLTRQRDYRLKNFCSKIVVSAVYHPLVAFRATRLLLSFYQSSVVSKPHCARAHTHTVSGTILSQRGSSMDENDGTVLERDRKYVNQRGVRNDAFGGNGKTAITRVLYGRRSILHRLCVGAQFFYLLFVFIPARLFSFENDRSENK